MAALAQTVKADVGSRMSANLVRSQPEGVEKIGHPVGWDAGAGILHLYDERAGMAPAPVRRICICFKSYA